VDVLTDINNWLESGEFVVKKQGATLDQGLGNQSDGTLYVTNRQLVFQVSQSGVMRGLDLKIEGQKDARIEYIWVPLEYVIGVEKKGQAVRVETGGSIFQEVIGRSSIFGPKSVGRTFQNGPDNFNFAMIFVNKDAWVREITTQRDSVLANLSQTVSESESQSAGSVQEAQVVKEKIIIKEIVKIKCPYCGSLYDQIRDKCPHCGAITR
jgi:hypothetical protein